jgi:hypothetical protein
LNGIIPTSRETTVDLYRDTAMAKEKSTSPRQSCVDAALFARRSWHSRAARLFAGPLVAIVALSLTNTGAAATFTINSSTSKSGLAMNPISAPTFVQSLGSANGALSNGGSTFSLSGDLTITGAQYSAAVANNTIPEIFWSGTSSGSFFTYYWHMSFNLASTAGHAGGNAGVANWFYTDIVDTGAGSGTYTDSGNNAAGAGVDKSFSNTGWHTGNWKTYLAFTWSGYDPDSTLALTIPAGAPLQESFVPLPIPEPTSSIALLCIAPLMLGQRGRLAAARREGRQRRH